MKQIPNLVSSGTTVGDPVVKAMQDKALAKSRAKKSDELTDRLNGGQLALWPESERGIPNELVRCAVFSAKNRKEKREVFRANAPLVVPVIGGGEVVYIGVDLFSLPKVTVGKLALAWGWLRKPMIPLVFLLTFQFPFEGAKA